jgi:hypothetical protein
MTTVFNRNPPFYNSTYGYDAYTGNVLGRVMTVGFRLKLK